jgi:hypothetical protein
MGEYVGLAIGRGIERKGHAVLFNLQNHDSTSQQSVFLVTVDLWAHLMLSPPEAGGCNPAHGLLIDVEAVRGANDCRLRHEQY